ncbi:cytochrome c3 family protein [Seleniivibrio woodruffii]|uniref:cytochrome c3 family protein n=1 Tax=Seleniivibrio woodruffii TaxID=1078050 RepID=UPI0026F24912|nr:cytochrome c3 family protein [Seleniivibrio woodruffii]
MWQKLKEFSRKDPLIFTLILAVIIAVGGYGSLQMMHATSKPEFCKTCHPKEAVEVRGEYYSFRKGIHSEAGVGCLDCHGAPGIQGYLDAHVVAGMRSLYHEIFTSEEDVIKHLTEFGTDPKAAAHAASLDSCVFCHSDDFNRKIRRNTMIKVLGEFRPIDDVVNPEYREKFGRPDIMKEGPIGVNPDHLKHYKAGVTCFDCHLGIGHAGVKNHKPKMETCFKCHDENRNVAKVPANDNCAVCHTMQKGVQQGTYSKSVKGDAWYMADLQCSDCHDDAFSKPTPEKCASCHDASYSDIMKETQSAYMQKLAKAQSTRDKYAGQRRGMPAAKLALFNEMKNILRILENDGSKGVHNPEYFDMMFDKVAELATAIDTWTPPVEKVEEHAQQKKHEEPKEEAKPAGPVNTAEDMAMLEGSETINLAERHVPAPTKAPVIFDHKGHAERVACAECHSEPGVLKFEVKEVKGSKNVFHDELCIKCHKEKKVKTSCNTCHKK